ncbi:aspartate dehydrogenase [Fodinicurvata halophila]|uniref:L-aspartate dehydrogenase n=1 Tax=Fodinicurvata halophila TaxID=1419723 RepID=A0ABV8UHH0_9PROT
MKDQADRLSVGVAGLGAVGMKVAAALDEGIDGLDLVAVSARDVERARKRASGFSTSPAVLTLDELPGRAKVIVECLPPELFRRIAEPVVNRGDVLVVASVGALLSANDLVVLAHRLGGRVFAPSGAVAGLDGLAAAAEAGLEDVTLVTRKPPSAFTPEIMRQLDTMNLTAPRRVFAGNAVEAVKAFPQNVNVAATVSLAGFGPERTRVEVWCDPDVPNNRHELNFRSAVGEVRVEVSNLPDPENPRSSAATGYSIVACLRKLSATLCIGS